MLWESICRLLTVCAVLILHVELAETEVAKRNVSCVVKKNVLWFQVTVDDVETVQTLQRAKQLSSVESGTVDVETLLFLQVVEQLASVDKGQNQVELFRRLERELEGNDEGIVDLCENRSLCQSMRDFRSGDDVGFSDGLEGVDSVCVLLPVECECWIGWCGWVARRTVLA